MTAHTLTWGHDERGGLWSLSWTNVYTTTFTGAYTLHQTWAGAGGEGVSQVCELWPDKLPSAQSDDSTWSPTLAGDPWVLGSLMG